MQVLLSVVSAPLRHRPNLVKYGKETAEVSGNLSTRVETAQWASFH